MNNTDILSEHSAADFARPGTKEELLVWESAPKTVRQKVMDRLIAMAPLAMGGAALAEYIFVPNMKGNESTSVYIYFILALMGALAALHLLAMTRSSLYEKLRYKAPFHTLVFFMLAGYDYLTLKTGSLMLPYFPWVDQILVASIADAGYLGKCALNSLELLFTGYFIGAFAGILTGIACGYYKSVDYWIAPFIKLLGSIPSVTWLPVVLVLAGTLFQGSVFIIALGVWFALTIATLTGIRNIDKSYFEAAKTLGASNTQLVLRIALPFALPNIFQGLTQGMSSACTALLIAEMVGVESGLGWYITWQKSWAQFGKMYAAIILICIIFIVVSALLGTIKNHTLRWQQGVVQE